VAYPVLSQYQSDRMKQNSLYLAFINNLSSIAFPIYLAIGIMAEPIVGLLLGDKWGSVVPLLRILALSSAARSVWQPSGTLMLSKGRADLHFYWSGLMLLLIPATVLPGYRWGIMGVAWCMMAGQLLSLLPNFSFWIRPVTGIGYGEYGRSLGRPLLLAAASGMVSYSLIFWIASPGLRVALFAAVSLLIYYFASRAFNRSFIRDIRQILIPSG
jgi:O-antigen/teichoic acid export membrane protein